MSYYRSQAHGDVAFLPPPLVGSGGMPDRSRTVTARVPYLLPWLRLHLLIRQIRLHDVGLPTWPTMRETLRDALKMQAAMRRRRGWWN